VTFLEALFEFRNEPNPLTSILKCFMEFVNGGEFARDSMVNIELKLYEKRHGIVQQRKVKS